MPVVRVRPSVHPLPRRAVHYCRGKGGVFRRSHERHTLRKNTDFWNEPYFYGFTCVFSRSKCTGSRPAPAPLRHGPDGRDPTAGRTRGGRTEHAPCVRDHGSSPAAPSAPAAAPGGSVLRARPQAPAPPTRTLSLARPHRSPPPPPFPYPRPLPSAPRTPSEAPAPLRGSPLPRPPAPPRPDSARPRRLPPHVARSPPPAARGDEPGDDWAGAAGSARPPGPAANEEAGAGRRPAPEAAERRGDVASPGLQQLPRSRRTDRRTCPPAGPARPPWPRATGTR